MGDQGRAFLLTVLRDVMNMRLTADDLGPDVPLGSNGLGLESLDLVELTVQADQALGVQIPDEDLDRISSFTVGEFLDYLDERAPGAGRPAVTAADIRGLLTSAGPVTLPADLRDDEEFVLDSLGRTWFAHELFERFAVKVDAEDDRLAAATSIEGLTEYVREHG